MRGGARWLTVAMGVVALVGGVAQVRRRSGGCGGAEVGDAGEVALTRRALPGFSIELPAGAVKEERLAYGTGKLEIRVPGGGVGLDWAIGEALSVDELQQMLIEPLRRATGTELDGRAAVAVPTATGGEGTQFALDDASKQLRLTTWRCGRRQFALAVGAPRSATALSARIVASFRCAPVAAEESADRRLPIVATLGPEIGLVEDTDAQLQLGSLDGEGLVVTPTTARIALDDEGSRKMVEEVLVALGRKAQIEQLTLAEPRAERRGDVERPVWRARGSMAGEPARVLFAPLECAGARFLSLYLAPAALPEARGIDLLLSLRCAAAGAPAPRPPPFAELAAAACARGDQRGCAR